MCSPVPLTNGLRARWAAGSVNTSKASGSMRQPVFRFQRPAGIIVAYNRQPGLTTAWAGAGSVGTTACQQADDPHPCAHPRILSFTVLPRKVKISVPASTQRVLELVVPVPTVPKQGLRPSGYCHATAGSSRHGVHSPRGSMCNCLCLRARNATCTASELICRKLVALPTNSRIKLVANAREVMLV